MKNVVIAVLTVVVIVLLVSFLRLAHRNNDLKRWNESLKSQVSSLTQELKKTGSNHVSDETSKLVQGTVSPAHQN